MSSFLFLFKYYKASVCDCLIYMNEVLLHFLENTMYTYFSQLSGKRNNSNARIKLLKIRI